jgi:hypothetical protein
MQPFKNLWPPSGEIVRICYSKYDAESVIGAGYSSTTKMLSAFGAVLARSKRLHHFVMPNPEDPLFFVNQALDDIIEHKRVSRSNKAAVFENMSYCLHAIRLINIINIEFHALKKFPFDMQNSNHRVLLEAFWTNMKPGVVRSKEMLSEEWITLGFQGSDPGTDFRGMGLLGMQQLVYFSQTRSTTALMILDESWNPDRQYFPFAVVGINITAFVLELLQETRLHQVYFNNFERILKSSPHPLDKDMSDHPYVIKHFLNIMHDMFCIIFEEFYLLWVVRNPSDIMAFNTIFNELKQQVRFKYKQLTPKPKDYKTGSF